MAIINLVRGRAESKDSSPPSSAVFRRTRSRRGTQRETDELPQFLTKSSFLFPSGVSRLEITFAVPLNSSSTARIVKHEELLQILTDLESSIPKRVVPRVALKSYGRILEAHSISSAYYRNPKHSSAPHFDWIETLSALAECVFR